MKVRYIFLGALFFVGACKTYNPHTTFDPKQTPPVPDYSSNENWFALPGRVDLADRTPGTEFKDMQKDAAIDIFFLHPTTLTGKVKHGNVWNGDVADEQLNKKTNNSSILYQASAFNGAGKIYAPKYRQAHLYSFFAKDKLSAKMALDTAYTDVVAAFEYYLEYYNHGRPFIIAGHSQGAKHALRLTKELIEGKPLEKQLVAAYYAGWPVENTSFKTLKPCETPEQTDCYCTWRTFERGYGLKKATEKEIVCTNPILWTIAPGNYAPKKLHEGAIIKDFDKNLPHICDAEVFNGVLLCSKPKFPGSFLLRTKNYHIGDINLYYMNIRGNAALRALSYKR
jgi:hypothetical protein